MGIQKMQFLQMTPFVLLVDRSTTPGTCSLLQGESVNSIRRHRYLVDASLKITRGGAEGEKLLQYTLQYSLWHG